MVENRVASRDDQANRGQRDLAIRAVRFEQHRVHMPLEMIHPDERFAERHREHFAVGDANEERANQARAARDGNRIHITQLNARLPDRLAHHRHDLPQVLARGEFRHHAAIFSVDIDLRRDHA